MTVDLSNLLESMKSDDPEEISASLDELRSKTSGLDRAQIPEVVEVVGSLFYIDLGDHPEFVHVVEDAVETIAETGEAAIPVLMELVRETDTKANLMIARTLGRIGPPAYGDLKDLFYNGINAWQRIMALFALAKMHEAALMEIFPDVVASLDDS